MPISDLAEPFTILLSDELTKRSQEPADWANVFPGQRPTVRGESALALARLEGAKVGDSLLRTYQEATTVMERIIASLALLVIDEAPPDDPEFTELRKELSTESLDYSPLIKDDILSVLRRSEYPQAPAIAEAWQGLYAETHQY